MAGRPGPIQSKSGVQVEIKHLKQVLVRGEDFGNDAPTMRGTGQLAKTRILPAKLIQDMLDSLDFGK